MFLHILIILNVLPSLLLCEPSSSKSRNMLLNGKECLEAPFRSGHCEKPEVAWSFDPARKKCQSFQYTGCGPSTNVFANREECERRCDRFSKVSSEIIGSSRKKRELFSLYQSFYGNPHYRPDFWRQKRLNRLCFKYSVDGKEDCKHFSEVEAWYYDRTSANCQNYKVCADKEILFLDREECMERCVPLYKDLLDTALKLTKTSTTPATATDPSIDDYMLEGYGYSEGDNKLDHIIDKAIEERMKNYHL